MARVKARDQALLEIVRNAVTDPDLLDFVPGIVQTLVDHKAMFVKLKAVEPTMKFAWQQVRRVFETLADEYPAWWGDDKSMSDAWVKKMDGMFRRMCQAVQNGFETKRDSAWVVDIFGEPADVAEPPAAAERGPSDAPRVGVAIPNKRSKAMWTGVMKGTEQKVVLRERPDYKKLADGSQRLLCCLYLCQPKPKQVCQVVYDEFPEAQHDTLNGVMKTLAEEFANGEVLAAGLCERRDTLLVNEGLSKPAAKRRRTATERPIAKQATEGNGDAAPVDDDESGSSDFDLMSAGLAEQAFHRCGAMLEL